MRLEFSPIPSEAFRQVWIMHLVMVGAIALCLFAGQLMLSADATLADRGYLDLENEWPIRIGFLLYLTFAVGSLILFASERRVLDRLMEMKPQELDLAVTRAITQTQLIRSTQGPVLASVGLVLFLLTGNRGDLYFTAILALALMAALRPLRRHWENVFLRASTKYPGVTPRPW